MEYLVIIISAVLVNNIVLSQFLGICPFLGVSSRLSTAVGMGAAVIFVMTMATIATFLIESLILIPLNLVFLRTIAFILVIASLVQLVEIVLKKASPALYQALGVYLPLITTNCAILGVALLVVGRGYTLGEGIVFAIGSSVGFLLALYIFAGLREKMDLVDIPEAMKGAPIALVTAGLLALAFGGFAGLV